MVIVYYHIVQCIFQWLCKSFIVFLQNRAIRIEAVAREQMERYEKYIQKLQAKVEKQREDRKISDEEFLRRIKAQDEVGNRKIGNGYRRRTIPMEDIGVGGVGRGGDS